MAKINITYSLEDFMKYKEKNMMLPPNLKPICNDMGGILILRDVILKEVKLVVDNFMSGKNPNDIIFKNIIIENLNKLNQKNYNVILESLRNLSYSKQEHFLTLISDIITRAMTDNIAIKGIELPSEQKTPSELYGDVVSEFSSLMIKENNSEIKFLTLFLDQCQKLFVDFSDANKPLDQNNQYRVDNFKGFMNFLGVLFKKHIVSHKIVQNCLDKVVKLMYMPTLGQPEAENVYEGYKRLLYNVYLYHNKKEITKGDKEFIECILKIHAEIKTQNDVKNKLRKFTMMSHKDLETKLQKIILVN
jgi:hypothetical protein